MRRPVFRSWPRLFLPGAVAEVFLLKLPVAAALTAAPASGDCSPENSTPATVASVNSSVPDGIEIVLDDGRRATVAGLEFPPPSTELRQAISRWLSGKLVFIGPTRQDRWGRFPALIFAASEDGASSPLIAVGEAAIDAGLARYRPDPDAAACRTVYLTAETRARARRAGLWSNPDLWPVDADGPAAAAVLSTRQGLTLVEGTVRSVGAGPHAIYLNFGYRRAPDFAVVISRRFSYNRPDSGFDPAKLIGRRVRVRGLIDISRGPRIEIATPQEIEIVDTLDAP